MFLDQILRRQEEYIKSLGPITKPVAKKPPRIRKAQTLLTVVPASIVTEPEIEQVQVVEELEPVLDLVEQEIALISPQLIPAYIKPTDEELEELQELQEIEQLDSGVFALDEVATPVLAFDLASIFDKYVPKTKGAMAKVGAKMVGLPVPDDIHARMVKFLETNKDKPNAPKSLKDLGLMCVAYALDTLESPQGGRRVRGE